MTITQDQFNARKFAIEKEFELYRSFSGNPYVPKPEVIGKIAEAIEAYLLRGN